MPLAQSRLALPGEGGRVPLRGGGPFPAVDRRRDAERRESRASPRGPFVLCVGTLEIRKNLCGLSRRSGAACVADPAPRASARLVLAGRPGWLNEDFERLMAATGNLGGWVRVLHGPTDAELDHLYRNCLFTVCVSLKEGWGLPIGESLAYGKTGVVSGVSSMPEVGGDLVEYCDPTFARLDRGGVPEARDRG